MDKLNFFQQYCAEHDVSLIVITKYLDAQKTGELIDRGVTVIGENRLQEAEKKFSELCKLGYDVCSLEKHFVGPLQSNKVAKVVTLFDMIQSVSRLSILQKIWEHTISNSTDILLQINITEEEGRHGFLPSRLEQALETAQRLDGIHCKGLMVMLPMMTDKQASAYFKKARQLFDKYKEKYNLTILSAGISSDYQLAVAAGATMIRIGRGVFNE